MPHSVFIWKTVITSIDTETVIWSIDRLEAQQIFNRYSDFYDKRVYQVHLKWSLSKADIVSLLNDENSKGVVKSQKLVTSNLKKCMYHDCMYYHSEATKYCNNACSSDAYDSGRLRKEKLNES